MNDILKNTIKGILWGIIICLIITLCSSCRTKYVAVPEVHTEYIVKNDSVYLRDSVFLHDSVYCALLGDTMYIERWHTKYIEKAKVENRNDTICKTDSIAVPYETIKYKTPRFNWVVMGVEFLSLALLALFIYIKKK